MRTFEAGYFTSVDPVMLCFRFESLISSCKDSFQMFARFNAMPAIASWMQGVPSKRTRRAESKSQFCLWVDRAQSIVPPVAADAYESLVCLINLWCVSFEPPRGGRWQCCAFIQNAAQDCRLCQRTRMRCSRDGRQAALQKTGQINGFH